MYAHLSPISYLSILNFFTNPWSYLGNGLSPSASVSRAHHLPGVHTELAHWPLHTSFIFIFLFFIYHLRRVHNYFLLLLLLLFIISIILAYSHNTIPILCNNISWEKRACKCSLCNLGAIKNTIHFIGLCPILQEFKLKYLGRQFIS